MSRVRRICIRGIRNFGEEEDVVIRFYRPVTLILGQNGTGKTTIVESLKFATCGEFPPNSDRGKFFIHDPTLTKTSSSRGVVKLEIVDSLDTTYTVHRIIESSKPNIVVKFKSLNSTLTRKKKDSTDVVTISNKCADVDAEVTSVMGVSKSILEYVIFCHQEELNWPFQDGKKLKEKFDEIFDTAKFNKSLERILKEARNMKTQIDILKEQSKSCQRIVTEVQEKETNLEDNKNRLGISNTKLNEIIEELNPINQKIEEMEFMDSKYKNLVLEEKKRKAEYDMSTQQLNNLQKNIKTIFVGRMEELLAAIESYDTELMKKITKIEKSENRLKEIAEDERKMSDMLTDERVTEGSLKQQIKDKDTKVNLRNSTLNEILSAWNLNKVDMNVSEIEVTALLKRLDGKTRNLERISEESRIKREEEEKELQKEVDHLRSEYSKIESEKRLKENELVEVREETDKIKSEIIQLGTMGDKLSSMSCKIQHMKNEIEQLNEEMDVNAARKDVLENIKLRDETETILNAVDKEIASLLKQSSLQAELELHKSTLLTKQKEMDVLKEKLEGKLKILLDLKEVPHMKLKNNLDTVQKELVNKIDAITRNIRIEEDKFTAIKTTVSHNERELSTKRKEVNTIKEKISLFCVYKDFDETLLLQSKKVKDLQDKRGIYAHQNLAYLEYMKQLKDEKPCCPICKRGFSEATTVVNLLREMENEVKDHPNRLKECEVELKSQQDKYNKLLELKPLVERVKQLEEFELGKLSDNYEKCKNRLSKLQTTIAELKETKTDPENKLAMCRDIMGDVTLWDRYIDEILNTKQQINDFEDRIISAGVTTKRSIEEAQTHRDELKASLKSISNDIENLQSQINMHNNKIHEAREKHNMLQEKKLRMRSEVEKLKQLKDKQEDLYSKEISLGKLIDDLQSNVAVAENKLSKGITILENKKKENREMQENDRKLVAERIRRLSDLEKLQEEINTVIQRKVPEALKRSESRIKDSQDMISKLLNEKKHIERSISDVKQEIASQDFKKRELSDNLTLRKIKETTANLKEEYSDIKQQLSVINRDQMVREWEVLQTRQQFLHRQENMIKGNQEELKRIIEQSTRELQRDIYRQARKNHRDKCIELKVTEKAQSDLKEYGRELDISMMQCHRERMENVNRIIKQLWKLVYTGKDTTSIEIRADATQGVGSSRRSYNYKLVQTKHGHEMDMKGRCSAGQKVLASILIRLALAETFCKDCGILALDEPTTNLDQENADSLAEAIAKIVKLRSMHQKNFQLIVISHDERFLLKLAEFNPNKGFYELYRKINGYTSVKHCIAQSNAATTSVEDIASSDEEGRNRRDESENSRHKQQKETDLQKKHKEDNSQSRRRRLDRSPDGEENEDTASKKKFVFENM